jgi:hypothetical protein
VWVGMPGMRWENVVPLIHSLIYYRGIPFFLVISIFLIFSEYLHFILGRILDHTRDVPGNILERLAIVN